MIHSKTIQAIALLLISGTVGYLFSERAKVLTFKERETERQIEAQRQAGFADIEIDTLHESLAISINGIKKMVDLGVDKQAALYLPEIPATDTNIFKKDAEGKLYIEFELPQGQSFVDFPKVYLYNGIGFIYPSEDFTDLDKIVLMFRRVNADGVVHVKEMRRLINPSPKKSKQDEAGALEVDSNSDIQLEYYQSFSSNAFWPNTPIQTTEPSVSMQLNSSESPLPYTKQKLIMSQYKKILRKVDRQLAAKQRNLELDQKRMVTKMLDYR